ncbi:breast cancer anti-estrogen resistance protein 3-like isoform X4 [Pomacea canaliculata]|nr:breast cancer anti-estrogen resistance protein 3-like isoform X4 [Pomacea canaliculata]XP_025112403.1 breast cancer anti-estrogen resistance protein 3-like isoform X4 [Pomacea canaliculata]
MAGRHIAIPTWLEALGLQAYLPLFGSYGGVEDLLYASEAEIKDLGLKNGAHRAKIVSSLRILREKYEKGKPTGSGVFSLQQQNSSHLSSNLPSYQDFPAVIASPEKLQQDLQHELNADPSELKSRAWYHGNISRQRAEALVVNSGDFLVRDSISKPGDFVLTCSWRGVALHFMVNAIVGDCAPGSLPSISYQFEADSFSSIQDLIQFYLSRQKPVTLASGAVLQNPIARSMPLSYYDSKYGSLFSLDTSGHYTPSQSPKPSPFTSPLTSPKSSPSMNRRGLKWTGSQPHLNIDDVEMDRSRSPSLDRCGSLPVINIIPPGGPGRESSPSPVTSPPPVVSHQRAGSAPVLNDDSVHDSGGGKANLSYTQSCRMTPAGSESNLTKTPPPKPSRIPSIKYKKRPVIVVRNKELYEDDGRDYSDLRQVTEEPSWLQSHSQSGLRIPVPQSPGVMKSHSFQGSKDSDINCNNISKNFYTLPSKSKQTKHSLARQLSDSKHPSYVSSDGKGSLYNIIDDRSVDNMYQLGYLCNHKITMPGHNLGSRISLTGYKSGILPAESRLLEPTAIVKTKSLLLSSNAKAIAGHLTKVDFDILRVLDEDDFGVGVTSGLELLTLPQGEQLRSDIIERWECLKLFVMTTIMTCNSVSERAHMLSQWIQTAGELWSTKGNMFTFSSVMEALSSPQVHRLRDTWLILRQNHTTSAYLFDTKLRPLLKLLNEGNRTLPLQNVCIPNVNPVAQLLHRDIDMCSSLMTWEACDRIFGLDLLLSHLDIGRTIASQSYMCRVAGNAIMSEVKLENDLEEVMKTEFHLRLMWGSKGAGAPREERLKKFEQLLMVLSEKLEKPDDHGTEV